MPVVTGVQGYTSLTQQTRLCLETSTNPGETLLLAATTGAGTMSLTTQPNTISATTGMHLHFYVIGNATAGNIAITGTNIAGGAITSETYHVPIAPQQAQGYSEFTTTSAFATVTASSIVLTTLTPCTIMVWGSFAGKFLLPITLDKEEKIAHHSPQDKRGILAKNFRVTQLTKGVDVAKLDSDLYPDSLWAYYMAIGKVPVVTTAPAAPTSLLAATAKAATMTLTTSLSTVSPGMFLIFAIGATNVLAGTIVLSGTDNYGNTVSETITVPASGPTTVYSTKRYASITNSGADKFATTGLTTAATIAVTGVFAWVYTWTYDGVNNFTPYSAAIEAYDGVQGVVLPGTILTDMTLDWQKEKEILLQTKGMAQDFLIVGDPTSTTVGTNPFATIAQPTSVPYVSWPASFYIDAGTGTPATTQDGTMLAYKLAVVTGRKWMYAGDGQQRPTYVTWDAEPDFSVDVTIIYPNYQNYINYFKPNAPLILATTFQGNLLGTISSTTYYESVAITLPCKVDTFKADASGNPVQGKLKIMSEYSITNLGYYYKIAVTTQTPPTYTS